jgi:hypothetical protein
MDLPDGFKRKEYIEVWYADLGKIASKHFGCSIEMHDVLDHPSQDSYHKLEVPSDRDWEYIWDEETLEYVADPNRGTNFRAELADGVTSSLTLDLMLDLLYDDGIIPAGDYLITIWW